LRGRHRRKTKACLHQDPEEGIAGINGDNVVLLDCDLELRE